MSAFRPAYDDEVSLSDWLADETQAQQAPPVGPPAAAPPAPVAPSRQPVGADASHHEDEVVFSEARQRERYGGLNWGAGLFGWIVAAASGIVLTGVLAGVVATLGMTEDVLGSDAQQASGTAAISVAGALLALWLMAYYAGGYVAGRMSRFDGGKQGVAVWLIGLLLGGAAAGTGILAGVRYDALENFEPSMPTLPAGAAPLTGVIAALVVLVATLLVAAVGGKVGCRYHRKVDDAAYM